MCTGLGGNQAQPELIKTELKLMFHGECYGETRADHWTACKGYNHVQRYNKYTYIHVIIRKEISSI